MYWILKSPENPQSYMSLHIIPQPSTCWTCRRHLGTRCKRSNWQVWDRYIKTRRPSPEIDLFGKGWRGKARSPAVCVDSGVSFTSEQHQTNCVSDCGGLVENTGGAITMMNMPEQYYDCVWIVQPLHKLYYLKTHLYVRISSIRGLGE